jgi:predicted RNA-binding Zn ribbon-like protein
MCLDFVNTVIGRLGEVKRDFLGSYGELSAWAVGGGIVSASAGRRLRALVRRHPRQAKGAFERAVETRETLYRAFQAVARGVAVERRDLVALDASLAHLSEHRELVRAGPRFRWEWKTRPLELDAVLWPVLDSAAELLTADRLSRVKECYGPDGCGWLFLDLSKNGSRRWCDMRICGNAAKARRFYRRHRKART